MKTVKRTLNIATLLFAKTSYTPAKARAWARQHDFVATKIDTPPTGRYHHLRQHPPESYQKGTFRTVTLIEGVKAIVGKPARAANPVRQNRTAVKAPAAKQPAVKIKGFRAKNPAEARAVAELAKKYEDWHWSLPAAKVIRVADRLVPNLVAIGKLKSFEIDGEDMAFPKGSWIGFDPKHPHERIHVIIPAALREKFRQQMKHAKKTVPLQEIAESTGGTQARYELPKLRGVSVGVIDSVTYDVAKGGDGLSAYIHSFGEQHSRGVKPKLAIDVSGRVHLVGGSARCPLAGISG